MGNTNANLDQMPKKNPLSFQIDLNKFEKATDEEKRQQEVMSESSTFFKDGMKKLMKKLRNHVNREPENDFGMEDQSSLNLLV